MAQPQVTLGNKLSMATQAASMVVLLVTIVLAWGRMDTRMTVAEGKIERQEAQLSVLSTQRGSDSAGLATLSGKIDVQNVMLGNLTTAMTKLDSQVEKLRSDSPKP